MEIIYAPKRIDASHLFKQPAEDDQYDRIIDKPTMVLSNDGNEVIAVFDSVDRDTSSLLSSLAEVKYAVDWRTDGMQSRSRTFGAQPRIPLRRNFCSVASTVRRHPRAHREVEHWAHYAQQFLEKHVPEVARAQSEKLCAEVLPDWRMNGDMFTSAIVNETVGLWHHHDAGNQKNSWNVMMVLCDAVPGGLTVFPEYGIAFKYDGANIIAFDGVRHLHGVTECHAGGSGYRYSLVYYALSGLAKCGTPQQEVDRIRKLKTEAERRRHSRNREELEDRIKGGKK